MSVTALLQAEGLCVTYPSRHGNPAMPAVIDASLTLNAGEALGLAGVSGCGKSSLARALIGLAPVTAGTVALGGDILDASVSDRSTDTCRRLQLMFQDATTALSPRRTVAQTLVEPLRQFRLCAQSAESDRLRNALSEVELEPDILSRQPHQLSSGQRQRVALARALIAEPDVLVADEPVSSLDVSVQARILRLLDAARQRTGLALLLVSHDLSVLGVMCERLAIMDQGRLVETGPTSRLLQQPGSVATQALINALPRLPGAAADRSDSLE